MGMSDPIPFVRYLDPRAREDARRQPIADSVNIPLAELEDRVSELPTREKVVRVVGPEAIAQETVRWLRAHDRKAIQIVKYSFASRVSPGRLWMPNEWLFSYLTTARVHDKPPGAALDLGCGGGRDAVYLAAHGWRVTAVDRLPDALDRGRELSKHYLEGEQREGIDWRCADVLRPDYEPCGTFDLIVCCFFFDRELVRRAKGWLNPGGEMVIEAFTTMHQQREGKPASPDRVVKPGEVQDLFSDMEIVRLDEGEHPRGNTARIWARKHAT